MRWIFGGNWARTYNLPDQECISIEPKIRLTKNFPRPESPRLIRIDLLGCFEIPVLVIGTLMVDLFTSVNTLYTVSICTTFDSIDWFGDVDD